MHKLNSIYFMDEDVPKWDTPLTLKLPATQHSSMQISIGIVANERVHPIVTSSKSVIGMYKNIY